MSVVVDHREQAGDEEEESDADEPADRPAEGRRVIQLPVSEYLDEETGEDSELRTRRTSLPCTQC